MGVAKFAEGLQLLIMLLCCVKLGRSYTRWAPMQKAGKVSLVGPPSTTEIQKIDWLLRFDGGSRGNPGLGGSGVAIYARNNDSSLLEVWRGWFFVGSSAVTNNEAEYSGLIEGLKQCVEMKLKSIEIQGDSELILRQVQGVYKVRRERLIPLWDQVQKYLEKIPVKAFKHIPREENAAADELANIAMDSRGTCGYYTNYDAYTERITTIAGPIKKGRKKKTAEVPESPVEVIASSFLTKDDETGHDGGIIKPPRKRRVKTLSPALALDEITITALDGEPAGSQQTSGDIDATAGDATVTDVVEPPKAPRKRRTKNIVESVNAT
jgi:ribonuclease HI